MAMRDPNPQPKMFLSLLRAVCENASFTTRTSQANLSWPIW